jgi:hypothetical protein
MDNGKKVTNLDGFKDSMFLLGTAKCHPPIRVQQNNASVPIPTLYIVVHQCNVNIYCVPLKSTHGSPHNILYNVSGYLTLHITFITYIN